MSEESGEKNFIVKKSLRPVPNQGVVEQAKKHDAFRPQLGNPAPVLVVVVVVVLLLRT